MISSIVFRQVLELAIAQRQPSLRFSDYLLLKTDMGNCIFLVLLDLGAAFNMIGHSGSV